MNKINNLNAKKALENFKLEISSELNNFSSDEFNYKFNNHTKNIQNLNEKTLINEYNNK